jgi:rhamnulokinase
VNHPALARAYAAVDLGASNGRVMVGQVGRGELRIDDVRRFANDPVHGPDGLHWDIDGLYREILAGLRSTVAGGEIASAGIDSWAIDYGLLDAEGRLLSPPFHYRDTRTSEPDPSIDARVDPAANYAVTGIQHLPFNTLYQLLREPTARLAAAARMLLIPDLLAFWLTGEVGAERTNASTTALCDVRTGEWSDAVIAGAGLPRGLFPALRDPGDRIGSALPSAGLDGLPIVAVASHDTASAVLAVPALGERFAYVCTGTWSLVGVELDAPVLSDASRDANFTNEVGVDGTIRYLRNVMGLWLLQECQRAWADPDAGRLLAAAEYAPPFAAIIDPDDADFLAPGDMPSRIGAYCARTDQPAPVGRAGYVRCVLESLALAHRAAVRDAVRLSGRDVDVVHVVGGGARNALLCQLTADACGRPVIAGPVEATALGNILVQARANGGPTDRREVRALVAGTQPSRRYDPIGDQAAWDKAASRIGRG